MVSGEQATWDRCPVDRNHSPISRSKQSSVKLCLGMAQNLIGRAEAARPVYVLLGQVTGQIIQVIVQPGENLLTVCMANWDRPHAGANHSQRGLVEINNHRLFRGSVCR